MKPVLWKWIVLASWVCLSPKAFACAACFGKSDSPLAYGMNAGIFVLLAVIGSMLGLITSFFVFVNRRSARLAESDPAGDAASL